jgi:hypothetical protein
MRLHSPARLALVMLTTTGCARSGDASSTLSGEVRGLAVATPAAACVPGRQKVGFALLNV